MQRLEGLEAVRLNPGMYAGGTHEDACHHLVREAFDNAVDEYSNQRSAFIREHGAEAWEQLQQKGEPFFRIAVTIHADNSVSVEDSGRGIPCDFNEAIGKSGVEIAYEDVHGGGKFNSDNYEGGSGGLHGVGAALITACSRYTEVDVWWSEDGNHYRAAWESFQEVKEESGRKVLVHTAGRRREPFHRVGRSPLVDGKPKTGTRVRFQPDWDFWECSEINQDLVRQIIRQRADIAPLLHVTFVDEREGRETREEFFTARGIPDLMEERLRGKRVLMPPLHFRHTETIRLGKDETAVEAPCEMEVAIAWVASNHVDINAYTNGIYNAQGGPHAAGLTQAVADLIKGAIDRFDLNRGNQLPIENKWTTYGMVAFLSVRGFRAKFEGQTKHKLATTEVRAPVRRAVETYLGAYLEDSPQVARTLAAKVIEIARVEKAAQEARELARRKSALDVMLRMPDKLKDCTSRNVSETELILVEGDSAGSTAFGARDRRYQAILPLRGKTINPERVSEKQVLDNLEMRALITAMGAGFGEDFDLRRRRYGRVIILTDADVDGSHIRLLLLTFIYRYMPGLIESGCVYVGKPPLYKIVAKRGRRAVYYAYSDEERDAIIQRLGGVEQLAGKPQRYKGLGEMNAEQLWETTLNPQTRVLKRVRAADLNPETEEERQIRDEIEAVLQMLMGNRVEPRREFLETYQPATENEELYHAG